MLPERLGVWCNSAVLGPCRRDPLRGPWLAQLPGWLLRCGSLSGWGGMLGRHNSCSCSRLAGYRQLDGLTACPGSPPTPCASRRVPTIDGHTEVMVKPGTQPGHKLRMRGYGVPMEVMGQKFRRGDQYVIIKVRIPRSLTADQRLLLEDFKAGKYYGGGSSSSSGGSGGGSSSGGSGFSGSSGAAAGGSWGRSADSGSSSRSSSSSKPSSEGPAAPSGDGSSKPSSEGPAASSDDSSSPAGDSSSSGGSGVKESGNGGEKRFWRNWFK